MALYLWGLCTIAVFVAAVPVRDAWRSASERRKG